MNYKLATLMAVGAFLFVGCDFNPTGPFEGFEGGDGATMTGVVQGSGVAFAPAGLGLRDTTAGFASGSDALLSTAGYSVGVIVTGEDGVEEEIGRVEVVNDSFTLRGLPEDFSIQFYDANDQPVGDPIEFSGVKPNQEVDVLVSLNDDGSVDLVEERRTGIDNGGEAIEIQGRAREVAVTSADGVTGSLRVDDYYIETRYGETSIRKGNRSLTLDDIGSGDQVHVRGFLDPDVPNEVFAWEIKLQEEEDDDGNVEACTYKDPAKSNHILVCHKGRTLSISPNAWPGHAGHGDSCGPC